MSQAEDLLRSLAEPTTYSTKPDAVIVIGDDRFINVPDSLKRIAVQYDHNIETVTFDCPRYWDEHDMSQMKIYINYMLPNETTGQYLAQNVSARGQRMTFDWTISRNVTRYKGKLSFLVCIKKTDATGDEENHWNSELNQELYVSEGLECTPTIVSRYPDIITQLLSRMDAVEAMATPEAMQAYANTWLEENKDTILSDIQTKGEEVLATIPADYTATASLAEEGARDKANAIILDTEGETIAIDDSADAYLLNLKVYGKTTQVKTTGKNLLPIKNGAYGLRNGLMFTDFGDGRVNVAGTATANTTFVYCPFEVNARTPISAGTYTVSGSPGSAVYLSLYVYESQEATDTLMYASSLCNGKTWTFTLDNDAYYGAYLYIASGKTASETISAQLEVGSVATEYEPYTGGTASPSPDWPQALTSIDSPSVGVYTKNLLKNNLDVRSKTSNGVTFTINDDGSVKCAGTVAADPAMVNLLTLYELPLPFKPGSEYIISGVNERVSAQVYEWRNNWYHRISASDEKRFTLSEYATGILVRLIINPGVTVDETVYPIIRATDFSDSEYESYTEQHITVDHTLPGIPVTSGGNYTDSNGQQWICDEIDFERGVYVQRIGEAVYDGTESWSIFTEEAGGVNQFYIQNTDHYHDPDSAVVLSNYFIPNYINNRRNNYETAYTSTSAIAFNTRKCTTLDEWGAWLSECHATGVPVTAQYILATPIETPLTAEELANFKMVRTNYPNTTILNDASAHMAVRYAADTKLYIDNKLAELVAALNNT